MVRGSNANPGKDQKRYGDTKVGGVKEMPTIRINLKKMVNTPAGSEARNGFGRKRHSAR
jgi:hypothetical protein